MEHTISLPDDVDRRLRREARRRATSVEDVAREAIETYLPTNGTDAPTDGGNGEDTPAARADELIAELARRGRGRG